MSLVERWGFTASGASPGVAEEPVGKALAAKDGQSFQAQQRGEEIKRLREMGSACDFTARKSSRLGTGRK